MSTVLLVVAVLAVLPVTLVAVARAVRHDGYGHRPPPRSHLAWDDGATSPSRR